MDRLPEDFVNADDSKDERARENVRKFPIPNRDVTHFHFRGWRSQSIDQPTCRSEFLEMTCFVASTRASAGRIALRDVDYWPRKFSEFFSVESQSLIPPS